MSNAKDLDRRLGYWVNKVDELSDANRNTITRTLSRSINDTLRDLRTAYGKFTQSDGATNAYTIQSQTARYRELLKASETLFDPATRRNLQDIYQRDLNAAYETGGAAAKDLAKILDGNESIKENTKMPAGAQLAAGQRLNAFWDKETTALRQKVTEATLGALQRGKGWAAASRDIAQALRSSGQTILRGNDELSVTARNGIVMNLQQRADLIARTELASAYIEGQMSQYRRDGYTHGRWSATGERTCPFCASREGSIYTLDELDGAIPAHPRCRCTVAPVLGENIKRVMAANDKKAAAAEWLDDAGWTAIRQQRIDEYLKFTGKSQLDVAKYLATPTNRERYLKGPDAKPAKPTWNPSGSVKPDLKSAQQAAERARENPTNADGLTREEVEELKRQEAEAKRAEEKSEKAAKKAEAEAAKKAQEALEQKEFEVVSKAFGDKGAIDRKKFRELSQSDRDRLVKAAKEKLAKAPKAKKAEKYPKEIVDAGLEPAWRTMNGEQRQKLLAKLKDMNAKTKAADDAAAQASKQGKALEAKVTKRRIEDRIAAKVIEPKSAKIKANDFGDALRMLTGQGELVGLNTKRLMAFQERYNIATITGTGNEKPDYFLQSRQLRTSLRAAQARKTDTNKNGFGNDRIFKEILTELETKTLAVNQRTAANNLKVNKTDGVGGHTANGQGAINVKVSKHHKRIDAKQLKELQDAVEQSVLDAHKGKPHQVTSASTYNKVIKGKRHYVSESDWLSNYIHEMGHQIHYAVGSPMPTSVVAQQWKPSRYGNSNKYEWFAETFTQYTLAPKTLKRVAPQAYQFVDDMVKRALTGRPGEVGRAEALGQEAPKRDISPDLVKAKGAQVKTLAQLKADAKAAGLKGYSKLKKAELEGLLSKTKSAEAPAPAKPKASTAKNFKSMTVAKLKAEAKQLGVKVPSKARKADILKLVESKAAELTTKKPAGIKKTQLKTKKAEPKTPKAPAKKPAGVKKTKADSDAEKVKQANDEIRKLSQKALGGKFTSADKAALAKWKKQRDDILGTAKPIEKLERTTKDIDFIYDSKKWESYGYKSRAEMEQALGDLTLWSGAEYEQIRAQQLANLHKTSPNKLSKYEKNKAQEIKAATDKDSLLFSADEYTRMANRLEDLVRRSPNYDGKIYRGMNVTDSAAAEALIKEIASGKPSNTLESWSNSKGEADKFTYTSATGKAATGKAGVNFRVKNRDGSPVASVSAFEGENEVLVPSGQRYRVMKVTKRIKKSPWNKGENYEIYDVDLELI